MTAHILAAHINMIVASSSASCSRQLAWRKSPPHPEMLNMSDEQKQNFLGGYVWPKQRFSHPGPPVVLPFLPILGAGFRELFTGVAWRKFPSRSQASHHLITLGMVANKLTVFCRPPVKMRTEPQKLKKTKKTHAKNSEDYGR